ncbi:MAG: PAS domain S-box protein [Pyrinomonadaceae bacterium]
MELCQDIINALTSRIVILDRRANIIEVNDAWREFAGNNSINYPNSGIGLNYIEVAFKSKEQSQKTDSPASKAALGIQEVIEGRSLLFEFELPFHSPIEKRWFLMRVTRFGEGENLRVVIAHVDITKLKSVGDALSESEEIYRILAETASDAIIRIDENSQIQFVNQAGERIFGYKVEEMVGQSLTMIMPEHLRQAHKAGIKRYLETKKRHINWESIELPARHRNGHIFSIEVSFGEFQQNDKHFFIGVARDITGRKKAEEIIQKTNERFLIAEEASNGFLYDLNPQTGSVERSAAVFNVTGFSTQELGDDEYGWTNLIHEDDRERVADYFKKVEENEPDYNVEYRILHKNGRFINVLDKGLIFRDDTGKAVRIVGTNVDITERKLSETLLKERELLALLSSEISNALIQYKSIREILSACADSMVRHLDAAFARIWTLNKEDNVLELQASAGIYTHLDGEHSRIPVGKYKIGRIAEERKPHLTNSVIGDERVNNQEWAKKEGMVAFAGYPLVVEDSLVGVVGMFSRNTLGEATLDAMASIANTIALGIKRKYSEEHLRESERNLRALANSIPQLAWMAEPDGFIFWYNQGWYEYTGTTPEQMEGWGWQTVHDAEILPKVVEGWRNSIATGKPFEMEFPLRGANGKFRWFLTRVNPLRDLSGKILRWFGTNTDVDDAKQIELEREQILRREKAARHEAEAANRAKDEFLSILSHELRTPLNSMLGWVKMLNAGMLDEAQSKQAFVVLDRNIRQQNNLIEDLLDVSRIITGKMRIETQEVDFVSIVETAVETIQPIADGKEISIEFQTDTASQKIIGDETRLLQVVNNLLNNAVKFTPQKGKVVLRLSQVNGAVRLEVIDSGIGIAPEFLPFIFDRFQQADSTTKRSQSGLGLGLTIVRHLTELHGGKIDAFSAGEGQGSTFRIELPQQPNLQQTEKSKIGNAAQEANDDLKGIRILLVDDDCDGSLPLQMLLEKRQAVVECADSARRALEKLTKKRFHILISDIGMPDMDGYELLKTLRQMTDNKNNSIPAIALTAYAAVQDRKRALGAGFQRHLSKPIDFDEFLSAVESLINQTTNQ